MIKITKSTDEYGDAMYSFSRVGENGEEWELGDAAMRKQDEGTEDELVWWEGYFDTKEISFGTEDHLLETIKRRKAGDEVRFA